MAKSKVIPVKVDGVEFDAMLEEGKELSSEVPQYPTEEGFKVADGIQKNATTLSLTLFVTAFPVTFYGTKGHKQGMNRAGIITKKLEKHYMKAQKITVKTSKHTYKNMVITGLSWTRTSSSKYSREIKLSLVQIRTVKRKVTNGKTPASELVNTTKKGSSASKKTGQTKQKAGNSGTKAATQQESKQAAKKTAPSAGAANKMKLMNKKGM